MGAAASTPQSPGPSSAIAPFSVKNAMSVKSPFPAISMKNALMSRKPPKKEIFTIKVPLHVAVSSALIIQRYIRRHLAKKRTQLLRVKAKNDEIAATEYLHSVRMQRVRSERSSDRGMLRRSMMEGEAPKSSLFGGSFSISMNSPGEHHFSISHLMSGSRSEKQHTLRQSMGSLRFLGTQEEEEAPVAEEKCIVYPIIGFVVKGKLENSGRKVFINVCSSREAKRMLASTMRLWTEDKHYDEDGELRVEEVIVVDCVVPSVEFENSFVYKDGVGMVPVDSSVKEMIADQCVMLLNSVDQCPDSFNAPIAGLRYTEDYRISPNTSLPKIKRGYVGAILPLLFDPNDYSMPAVQPFRLSKELPPISTTGTLLKCPPEVKVWMALAWSCLGATTDSTLSKIAQVGQRNRKLTQLSPLDAEIETELEAHQKQYVDQVRKLKEGYKVFVVLNYGMLFVYATDNAEPLQENASNSGGSGLTNKYPYGKQEMIRIALSSVELDVSSDLVNDLFFLHLEFLTEELETLFTLSKFLNKISSTTVNMRKITLQFNSYTEVLTWKTVFEYHMQYAQYAIAKMPSLLQNVKFHNVSMLSLPSGKASWFTEKLGKRTRRRIFAKIDRGWWIIFPNDSSVTPSLLNAIEIFPLASMRCEVSHKKIVRLRKWITKITFFDDEDAMKREFYLKSNDGEHDPDTKTILTALATNITYSHSQYYRYLLPWLDDNDLLHDLTSSLGGSKASSLSWVACSLDVQISIPEPQTSDDDSDVEAEKDVDESTAGALFRVLKPKASNSNAIPSLVSTKGASSRQMRTAGADEGSSHSRFQQVCDRINSQYNDFSSGFFKGRVLLYQDQNCLLFLHENRIVGILNVARCMEKVFPQKKKKFAGSVPSTPVDSTVYDLQSDDESDTSDRDYFEDQPPQGEDERIKSWVIQLIGYDGRVYKLKFSNSTEFEDWRKSFASRCIVPSAPTTSSPAPLKSQQSSRLQRGESFKGNHTFEYLKEHVVSSAESTASTASMLTASTLSLGGASTVTANLLSALSRQQSNLGHAEPSVDTENTKRYARSLRTQEKVYGCGMVFKYEKTASNTNASNAPKQKRIMLLTDVPRMIFIDPIGNIARGNIELLPDLKVEVKEIDQSDFEVLVSGASNRFSVADEKDVKFWVRMLQFLLNK